MTAIDLEQAKISVDRVFQSALDGDDVIITESEMPILKLSRIGTLEKDEYQTNALDGLSKIRISGSGTFSVDANIFALNGKDE